MAARRKWGGGSNSIASGLTRANQPAWGGGANSIQSGVGRAVGPQAAAPGFTPFQVPSPPPGYYDPALDAQQGAAARGLLDTTQDVGTQNVRDTVDYGLGQDAIRLGQTRGNEDLTFQRGRYQTGFDRNTQDLTAARDRGGQDYQRNVDALTRRYGQLGDSQRQQQSRSGVMRGGAMLQAAAKRTANQALDQQPLDTSFERFKADNAQAQDRLGQDRTATMGQLDAQGRRLQENTDLGLGELALKMAPPDANNPVGGRSFQDRTTALTRAQRENANFGLDVGAQRQYQAAGAGWQAPQMPSNEFVDASGNHRQVQTRGKQTVAVDPTGRVLWRRQRGR